MTEPLTPLERRVYHYLLDFLAENTYQPSIREIGKRFRIKSTKTVSDLLQSLAEKGYIEREGARSRGVKLLGFSTIGRTVPVPCYTTIADAEPALRPEHRERYITLDRAFVPGDDAFFLRVAGEAMIGRGIHDRDYVLINPSVRARDGDIIAARFGPNTVVRTLEHRGATILLAAANSDEREVAVRQQDDFAVLGVVSAVFRPFHDEEKEGTEDFQLL
jgi:repressor LexA